MRCNLAYGIIMIKPLNYFLFILFFLQFRLYPPSSLPSNCSTSHPCLQENVFIPPTQPDLSLGPQVSQLL